MDIKGLQSSRSKLQGGSSCARSVLRSEVALGVRSSQLRSSVRISPLYALLAPGSGWSLLPAGLAMYFSGLAPSRLHSGTVKSAFDVLLITRLAMALGSSSSLFLSTCGAALPWLPL